MGKTRGWLNFEKMDIPTGSELVFTKDPEETVEVLEPRSWVIYQGVKYTLEDVTRILLNDSSVQGGHSYYWSYNGRSLREIYEEMQ